MMTKPASSTVNWEGFKFPIIVLMSCFTVTHYFQDFEHLKLAIDRKWLELTISVGVVFHQDNVRVIAC